MFLQSLTKHQSHLLTRFALIVVVVLGFLLLAALLKKKTTKTNSSKPEFLNLDEQRKRKSKNRWRKSGRKK